VQILKDNHYHQVCTLLHERLTEYEKQKRKEQTDQQHDPDIDDEPPTSGPTYTDAAHKSRGYTFAAGHVVLRSQQPSCTYEDLEQRFADDLAFQNFCV